MKDRCNFNRYLETWNKHKSKKKKNSNSNDKF